MSPGGLSDTHKRHHYILTVVMLGGAVSIVPSYGYVLLPYPCMVIFLIAQRRPFLMVVLYSVLLIIAAYDIPGDR